MYKLTIRVNEKEFPFIFDEQSYLDFQERSKERGYITSLIATAKCGELNIVEWQGEESPGLSIECGNGFSYSDSPPARDNYGDDSHQSTQFGSEFTGASSSKQLDESLPGTSANATSQLPPLDNEDSNPTPRRTKNVPPSRKRATLSKAMQLGQSILDPMVPTESLATTLPDQRQLLAQIESSAPTPPKRKVKPKLNTIFDGELLDEAEAFLLTLVFDRPLLFDYKMAMIDRNPVSLSRAWAEVLDEMKTWIREKTGDDANITLEVLKDTWMTIRTAYMRYKNSTKLPSGSSPSKNQPEMKHMDLLSRYDSVAERRRTISTLDDENDCYDEEYAEERVKACVPPKKRGRGANDEFLNVAKQVLHTMSNRIETKSSSSSTATRVEPPAMSSSRHFAESLVADLDTLKGHRLSSAKMRITQVIFEEISEQLRVEQ